MEKSRVKFDREKNGPINCVPISNCIIAFKIVTGKQVDSRQYCSTGLQRAIVGLAEE